MRVKKKIIRSQCKINNNKKFRTKCKTTNYNNNSRWCNNNNNHPHNNNKKIQIYLL